MGSMKNIFLSSTGRDLYEYRKEVYQAINKITGYHCVRMEDFVATDVNPLEHCINLVQKCDIFVGLIGHYYGDCPDGEVTSFTEQEYEAAVKLEIPRLMFIAPDKFLIPANTIESGKNYNKQKKFRKRILKERIASTFDNPKGLATEVITALFNNFSHAIFQLQTSERCIVVIEGAKSTEVYVFKNINNKIKFTNNTNDRYIIKITVIPVSTLEPKIFDFSLGKLPLGVSFERYSGGYYRPRIGSDVLMVGDHVPRFEEIEADKYALLYEPPSTNILLHSNEPRSQNLHLYPGNFSLWVEGSGCAELRENNNILVGAATEKIPLTFSVFDRKMLTLKVIGKINYFQLNSGRMPLSHLPTKNYTLTRAGDMMTINIGSV